MTDLGGPWEIVKTLEFQPIEVEVEDVPDLRYRVEILKPLSGAGPFRARGYRWDMYEMKPFGCPGVDISHDDVLVRDSICRGRIESVEGGSLDEITALILEIFETEFP
jgi:hypothetical protein